MHALCLVLHVRQPVFVRKPRRGVTLLIVLEAKHDWKKMLSRAFEVNVPIPYVR